MKCHKAWFHLPPSFRRCWASQGRPVADSGKRVILPVFGPVTVTESLNFLGVDCLRTNLLTKKAMGLAGCGDVLEIITDNPSSAETIPFMLPNYGCLYLATIHEERYRVLYVRKVMA